MASQHIPGNLNGFINTIQPELGGLAYHIGSNCFSGHAGNINSNE
jgi:hypothetical protein